MLHCQVSNRDLYGLQDALTRLYTQFGGISTYAVFNHDVIVSLSRAKLLSVGNPLKALTFHFGE